MKVVSEHERAVRSRSVGLELDEGERFEVAVPRYRQEQQRWMWNEVGGRRIGVTARWGGWAWSLRWARA